MRFRSKSLTGLLYAVLLAIPLISVVSKVIYVQSNKNAYQNYSGLETMTNTYVNSNSSFVENKSYTFNSYTSVNIYDFNFGGNEKRLTFNNPRNFNTNIINVDFTRLNQIGFYKPSSRNDFNMYFFDNEGNQLTNNSYSSTVYFLSFDFDFVYSNLPDTILQSNFIYYVSNEDFNYMDNVFEYAIDEVIKENNFGKIDFFSYFTSIFMNDNAVNNRYIGYVNYYLNYALMVSLAYLLFLMLMWFVNFARRFLDRGMNYDW